MADKRRLIVVSNRLPAVVVREEGRWQVRPGAGGLVAALTPVLGHRGGLWVGWPGLAAEDGDGEWRQLIVDAFRKSGYDLEPVELSRRQVELFYEGFSNQVIWPLFHDLLESCRFKPEFWYAYLEVNQRFAEVVDKQVDREDFVWIQDYQIMHVGESLRRLGCRSRLGFFLHIPFPPLDVFLRLPWRREVLRALLEYDLVGLQTLRDRDNFIGCLRRFLPETKIRRQGAIATARLEGREIQIGAFPIGIDYRKYRQAAARAEVARAAARLRSELQDRYIVLGLDRLDYTKGLPERLRGFRSFLERYPEWQERVVLRQVLVPSRVAVPRYRELKSEVERLVGEINGRFGTASWVPVNYGFGSLSWEELLAHYRVANVNLVTSLKDGMNLVCKEYCACQRDGRGVVVLSEFAGAAAQLKRGALLVNPFDAEGVGAALDEALRMEENERRYRMRQLQEVVRRQDIFWWVNRFLRVAAGHPLEEFSTEVDYDLRV